MYNRRHCILQKKILWRLSTFSILYTKLHLLFSVPTCRLSTMKPYFIFKKPMLLSYISHILLYTHTSVGLRMLFPFLKTLAMFQTHLCILKRTSLLRKRKCRRWHRCFFWPTNIPPLYCWLLLLQKKATNNMLLSFPPFLPFPTLFRTCLTCNSVSYCLQCFLAHTLVCQVDELKYYYSTRKKLCFASSIMLAYSMLNVCWANKMIMGSLLNGDVVKSWSCSN